jgi:tetraacyldisaccharide 4'-kinase
MTASPAPRPYLLPLVPLYRLALGVREFRLRRGWEPVRRLRFPVVSIGNLSTGGAGKTPLTIALAQALTRRGFAVDVLSRGYGRVSNTATRVDPSGAGEDFGDEPLLIAREAGVSVYVARQRYAAGRLAEGEPAADWSRVRVHILDDAFQHRQLHRDVNILLLNRQDWHDRLLPAGNLREPLSAANRADVIAIPESDAGLESELCTRGWTGTVWRLQRRMDVPRVEGPVAGFCGIARPEQFFAGVEAAGLRLANRIVFRDHHRYTLRDLDRLQSAARSTGATALMTTAKDQVRIAPLLASRPAGLPILTAGLRIEIQDEAAALDWLEQRLHPTV